MSELHEHAGHVHDGNGHGAHQHGGHGAVMHGPPADVFAAYGRAYTDAQPAPGRAVVKVELEARETEWEFTPGRLTRAWGYNGSVPGPVIEAHVGDVLEVRLTNRLSEPTTIHWHGLRVPSAMDGTDMAQHPIPSGESFTYRFTLPDAGTFWYHPHSNETVQLERGLYGALIVRAPDEPAFDAERIFVLDDVTLDGEGQVAPPGGQLERHDGREGGTRLLNGKAEPRLTIRAGQIERWRIVNAASARYVRLSIGGRPFHILGTGGGFLETPVTVSEVLLVPGDRVEIAVGPFNEGDVLQVQSLPYNRGTGAKRTERFATLRVEPGSHSKTVIPERLRTITPLIEGRGTPTREVRFTSRHSAEHGVDFLINDETHHRAEPVTVGELQVWDILNESRIDHPFHLHGFFFQILERNGEPPAFRSWEDTVNVPAKGQVRIAWVPDDRPGEWMYHCHILEHHEAGMMAHFVVVRPAEKTSSASSDHTAHELV
jgi:FtsP/CotA-like multicopper oxidase with cupredoxin domain